MSGVRTNSPHDFDRLKHMRADASRDWAATNHSNSPIFVVYTRPVWALLILGSKGWLEDSAFKLGSPVGMSPSKQSQPSRAARDCMRLTRRAHKSHYLSTSNKECSTTRDARRAPLSAAQRCAVEAGLRVLAPLADYDWVGLERHFVGWVQAACAKRRTIVLVDGERLAEETDGLAARLGIAPSCQQPLCARRLPDLDEMQNTPWRGVLERLNQTHAPLAALMQLVRTAPTRTRACAQFDRWFRARQPAKWKRDEY